MGTNIPFPSEEYSKSDARVKEYIFLLEQYKNVVDESNIVSKTNPNGIITYVNSKFEEISGYSRLELLGKPHSIIRHPDMPQRVFERMWNTISSGKTWHGLVKNRKKDGGHYYVEATIIPIQNSLGKITEYIAIRKDITRLMDQNKRLRTQTTDNLTGLPNYNKLAADAEKANGKTLVLLNIDLFREIVDFYGETIANKVLVALSKTFKEIEKKLEKGFTLYKLYGDEFAFFKPDQTEAIKVTEIIRLLHSEISREGIAKIHKLDIHYSVSMGAYSGKEKHSVNKAKIALKYARETKRFFYLYDDILKSQHRENLKSVRMLKEAISNNRVIAYYQPIINNATGKIEKYESLVRIIDEKNNTLLPESFLAVAKKSKLYPYITLAMLDNVLHTAQKYEEEFSMNISSEDISNQKIMTVLYEALKAYPEAHQRITFEITESENIENFEEVKDFITRIKSFGCKVAIDDFGAGYSNFEYLTQLEVDYLKFDGSLIKNLHLDPTLKILVAAIVNFAREMGYKTIAEFIHSEKVFEEVKKLGIDYSQGYYFGKPLQLP